MLVNRLEKLNLDKNTIIVVMGDHGYQLGDQQVWGKHTNYNLSTRVPLIIFDPSMAPIKNNSEKYVELLDIFPTLSDLVSIPKPVDLDGKSFMTLFHNSDPEGFNSSFSQYRSFQKDTEFSNLMSYAIHTKNYTFIEWQDLERDYKVVNRELYALTKGTIENKNISFDPEYSGKVEELSKELNQKFKQYRSKAKKYKNHYRN
jgi:arylsulfatase A-like enzyme